MRAADEGGWAVPGSGPASSPLLSAALGRLSEALEEVAGLPVTALSDADLAGALSALTAASGRLSAALVAAAAEADHRRLGDEIGARHTAAWWSHRDRLTRGEASRLVGLGRRLGTALAAPVAAALAAGDLRTDQADVITRAVEALPDQVAGRALAPGVREAARDHLLVLAGDHDAAALRRLGKRILDVVAPETGEAHEAALLEREETAAAAAASLTMVDDGHGRCHGRFTLPAHTGAALRRHLLALANPRRTDATADTGDPGAAGSAGAAGPGDIRDRERWRPMPERLGAALVEYVERYPADHVPTNGGLNATVVVTMTLDSLLGGLGAATLEDGTRISAGTARRMACEAGIIPAVLGSRSQPLDLGRRVRLHNQPQRLALALRDGGCTARGCDLPPAACHAHHDHPWSRGGPTTLANGRLLCPRHHRLAHHTAYETTRHPDNSVTFHRRT